MLIEFDPDRSAVIEPVPQPVPGFPEICIGIFSKAIVDEIAEKYHGQVIGQSNFCTGPVYVYKICVEGTEIALFMPHVGEPAASGFIEEIWPLGGKYFVFAGACGVLRHDIADGHLILPTAALRDEGLSYHYLPPSEEVVLDPAELDCARRALEELGLPYVEGKTWTTDAFYRETRGKMAKRKDQGCICVEMECAGLAAVARFRGLRFSQFFWAADNLDAPEWDARNLALQGAGLSEKVFRAAVETGKNLQTLGTPPAE